MENNQKIHPHSKQAQRHPIHKEAVQKTKKVVDKKEHQTHNTGLDSLRVEIAGSAGIREKGREEAGIAL